MIRRSSIGMLVALIALGAMVSSAAGAGTPVKQETVAQLRKIQANPGFRSLKTFKIKNAADAHAAIPKLDALRAVYSGAVAAVGKSTATTTAKKTARTDWTSAVKTNISGIGDLITGLQEFVKGDKSEAQTEIDNGVKLDASANEESLKAYKLLGISV